MALFSQRNGIRLLQKAIQRESIDDELRNGLWNVIQITIWNHWKGSSYGDNRIWDIASSIWIHYFKKTIDALPGSGNRHSQYLRQTLQEIRQYFFAAKWWEVYDFIEFMLTLDNNPWANSLCKCANGFLERENAAYRVIENRITEITDQNEIESIENALENGIPPARIHLQKALELLSDRKQPDFRNSIKESISAVEATCRTLTCDDKATLGDCLKQLKSKKQFHPAFEKALHQLYGYTSDEGGIRHSLTDESEPPAYSDAKFMLVTCSAFTNYLLTKSTEEKPA